MTCTHTINTIKAQRKQQLREWPNATEKSLWIFRLQAPQDDMWQTHKEEICLSGGFWAAQRSPHCLLDKANALIGNERLKGLHWRYVEEFINTQLSPGDEAIYDALIRYRHSLGAALPINLLRHIRRTYPLLSLPAAWNTTPPGRWRRAREAEAYLHYSNDLSRMNEAVARMQAKIASKEAMIARHDALSMHRIAKAQINRDGPNALLWSQRADEASHLAGIGSRYNLDNARIAQREADRVASSARADIRRQNAAIRRYRQLAVDADRQGDIKHATYLRQQAADLNRVVIDATTGEHVMTHQPPARPATRDLRNSATGRKLGTGGARQGAGRKPLFKAPPPAPTAQDTAHTDGRVSAARRWTAYADYLDKHFTYVAATGELIGPSGRPLDLRNPVSTPIGALRPGLLIAALLHGKVTRRYALPRGIASASRWPMEMLTVSVIDRERDAGLCQHGVPSHLLVPPEPCTHTRR